MSPVMAMIAVVSINHLVSRSGARHRSSVEKWRLAAAIRAELSGLRELYEDNLTLIMEENDRLLSARGALHVYKANIGRLTMLLDETPLGCVVAACATADRIEAHIAASTTPNGGFAYKVDPKRTDLQGLKRLLVRGCDDIDAAVAALDSSAGAISLPARIVAQPCSEPSAAAGVRLR
jgi:hypothetical protein